MDSGAIAMEDRSCHPRDCAWRAQVRFWVARSLQVTIWNVVFVHIGGLMALSVGVGVHAVSIGTFEATHCARCEGLKYCTAMNGKLYFDPVNEYTREATTQLEKQGVCEDLDAKTLELSSFGDQFQFKDTEACHMLVWNYHCLSWVAATFQRAIDGVNVSCATATDDAPVPLPPCRSLCVEVADKCVYSHFYRMYLENVCGNVPCVSEEEELLTAKTSSPKKQADCVKAPWESVPNTTFSRCSIREYVAPKASACRLPPSQLWPALLCLQTAVWLYLNFC